MTEPQFNISMLDSIAFQISDHSTSQKGVEILPLNVNDITEVAPYTFFEKSKLKKAGLTVNKMSSIDRNSLRNRQRFSINQNSSLEVILWNVIVKWFGLRPSMTKMQFKI